MRVNLCNLVTRHCAWIVSLDWLELAQGTLESACDVLGRAIEWKESFEGIGLHAIALLER